MGTLPSFILFINSNITYPAEPPPTPPFFIGSIPENVNSDASVSELTNLQIQLFLDDVMVKKEFDARVATDPNYPTIVHLQNLRIMVILDSFHDGYNRDFADVVMFLYQGLAYVEKNRIGTPGQTFNIQRISVYDIIHSTHHEHGCITVPFNFLGSCGTCQYPFFCDFCHTFSGIKICRDCGCDCQCGCSVGLINNQGIRQSPVHLPNCDREFNNIDFIRRK